MSPVSAAERRKHWQNVLDRQAASGKPISVFCAEENIAVPSFYLWRKKLQNDKATANIILPVKIVPSGREFPPAAASRSTLDPQWILAAVRCIDPC